MLELRITAMATEPHYPVTAVLDALEALVAEMRSITPEQQENYTKTGVLGFNDTFEVNQEFAHARVTFHNWMLKTRWATVKRIEDEIGLPIAA